MNTEELELALVSTAEIAKPTRSVVDDVMRRLPTAPLRIPPTRVHQRFAIASLAAPAAVVVAGLAFFCFGTNAISQMTLAEVKAAMDRQTWVHIRYDAGQLEETWTNLELGESYTKRFDGNVVYVNRPKNLRLWYWKQFEYIAEDTPVIYPAGKMPEKWQPKTAWEEIVGPLESRSDGHETKDSPPSVTTTNESIDGAPMVRFDQYGRDGLGKRFLYLQLWADPKTRLPVRIKTRLQFGERDGSGKEWSTGSFDFPATGPSRLADVGVPESTKIQRQKSVTTDASIQEIFDGIENSRNQFLKKYRMVSWADSRQPTIPFDSINILWRSENLLHENFHLPSFEAQNDPSITLPPADSKSIFEWCMKTKPSYVQLLVAERQYTWRSTAYAKSDKPVVQVILHRGFPLLDRNCWLEEIQWPVRQSNSTQWRRLETTDEMPPNCLGLRDDRAGNRRHDYYIDPTQDFICIKNVWWVKRADGWAKDRETTLSDLNRVSGRIVAGKEEIRIFRDPDKGFSGYVSTNIFHVEPLSDAEFPSKIFDPDELTEGAEIIGY